MMATSNWVINNYAFPVGMKKDTPTEVVHARSHEETLKDRRKNSLNLNRPQQKPPYFLASTRHWNAPRTRMHLKYICDKYLTTQLAPHPPRESEGWQRNSPISDPIRRGEAVPLTSFATRNGKLNLYSLTTLVPFR